MSVSRSAHQQERALACLSWMATRDSQLGHTHSLSQTGREEGGSDEGSPPTPCSSTFLHTKRVKETDNGGTDTAGCKSSVPDVSGVGLLDPITPLQHHPKKKQLQSPDDTRLPLLSWVCCGGRARKAPLCSQRVILARTLFHTWCTLR